MNKSLEKYYKHFERPPFAPTYCPTEEEFLDPIAYVAKIKPEAERYGVVKIRPPAAFRPPFAIDSERFEFTPRVQKLNQIEGPVRARLIFDAELADFWHMQGRPLQTPVVDNRFVDMFRFSRMVSEAGGAAAVTANKRWPQIARQIGFKNHVGSKLRDIHAKWIAPYEESIRENVGDGCCQGSAGGECVAGMHDRRRLPMPKSRMMAGIAAPIKEKKVKEADPMDDVVCKKCARGDDEDRLLLCEDCDYALHIYCCSPPLSAVPKAEWRCRKCVVSALRGIADSFGFHDAHTHYNLLSFAEFANEWKRNYFQENPLDVSCETVENEFWAKVIDVTSPVTVKYGADLLANKVGSGFPMPKCDFKGSSDRAIKEHYAHHPWNLNNLPVLKESVLSFVESGISGMMVPWVYVGMCFSTFCWHTEDHWTYSVNYLHWGERKIWYGVSGFDAEKFENVVRSVVPDLFEKQPDLLHHMTTTINPCVLMSKGVKVHTVHQEAGEFVITFPRAFHAGYNEGLNFAEAVNFAPADWLRIGRSCVADYGRVRRHCVFSHEELVLRMAKKVDDLSVALCIAVHEELHEICQRETKLRESAVRFGICSSAREEFESVADDMRCCVVCRTTVFMSAVCCSHGRLVCLDHFDVLCKECSPEQLTLKYRYTLEELAPLLKSLFVHSAGYNEWCDKVASMLHSDDESKPAVEDLRAAVDVARLRRYPRSAVLEEALAALKASDEVAKLANELLSPKLRADGENSSPPVEASAVDSLKSRLQALPCSMSDIENLVGEFVKKVDDWRSRADTMLSSKPEGHEQCDAAIFDLQSLLDEYSGFAVRITETVEKLKNMMNQCRWVICAEKLVYWNVKKKRDSLGAGDERADGSTDDDEYCSRGRWKLQKVMNMMNEGTQIAKDVPEIKGTVNAIHRMLKQGYKDEFAAEVFLTEPSNEGIGVDEGEKRWERYKASDWMSEENINALRKEVFRARNIRRALQTAAVLGDITLKRLNEVQLSCVRSLFVRGSSTHTDVKKLCDRLRAFCIRVRQLFVRSSASYYSLFEIVSVREDLSLLTSGTQVPLHQSTSQPDSEYWPELERFGTAEELREHLRSLEEMQCNQMLSLRQANDGRSVRETCSCGEDGAEDEPFMCCFLCHGKFHASCISWNSFMNCLPAGHFLCVRCVRGQRPCIEDVSCALTDAPPSLEKTLISHALERSIQAHREARNVIASVEPGTDHLPAEVLDKVDKCLIPVLCAEVMDLDAWSLIAGCIPRVLPIDDSQRAVFAEIRNRPVASQLPTTLFAHAAAQPSDSKKGKRSSASASSCLFVSPPHRKRHQNDEHSENEICSADLCFKPAGNSVRWIQCESGCSRWFHCTCIGVTVKQAKKLTSYCCYRCSSDAASQLLATPTLPPSQPGCSKWSA